MSDNQDAVFTIEKKMLHKIGAICNQSTWLMVYRTLKSPINRENGGILHAGIMFLFVISVREARGAGIMFSKACHIGGFYTFVLFRQHDT